MNEGVRFVVLFDEGGARGLVLRRVSGGQQILRLRTQYAQQRGVIVCPLCRNECARRGMIGGEGLNRVILRKGAARIKSKTRLKQPSAQPPMG